VAAQVKARVVPIAKAIEPILEAPAIDRLRGQFLRFVKKADAPTCSVGQTLPTRPPLARACCCATTSARALIFALEDGSRVNERMDDLIEFATSERYSKLRKQIGINIEPS